jgi:hypothetical protein
LTPYNSVYQFQSTHVGGTTRDIEFNFAGTTAMRLQASTGNVGIGTTVPGFALDVVGSINSNNVIYGTEFRPALDNGLRNRSNTANAGFYPYSAGPFISRNIADANPSLIVNQANTSSTGDILNLQFGGATQVAFKSSGNVGIGTTSPAYPLHIDKSVNGQDTLLLIRNTSSSGSADIDFSVTTGSITMGRIGLARTNRAVNADSDLIFSTYSNNSLGERMRILDSGNVGIGTTNPGYALSVNGKIGLGTRAIGLNGTELWFQQGVDYFTGYNFAVASAGVGMYINSSGNIGIGTTGPSSILSFGGDAARVVGMERNTTVGGSQLTVKAGGALLGGTNLAAGDLYLSTGVSTGTGVGNMYFQTATAGTTGTADNAPTTKLTILGSGNVGIGTTGPATKLNVNVGDIDGIRVTSTNSGLVEIYGNSSNWALTNHYSVAGNFEIMSGGSGTARTNRFTISSTGNVGIGTTAPSAKLSVLGSDSLATTTVANISGSIGTGLVVLGSNNVGFGVLNPTNKLVLPAAAYIAWKNSGSTGLETSGIYGSDGNLSFNAGGADKVYIQNSTGNVGIGTTAPTQLLQVVGGNILIDSTK